MSIFDTLPDNLDDEDLDFEPCAELLATLGGTDAGLDDEDVCDTGFQPANCAEPVVAERRRKRVRRAVSVGEAGQAGAGTDRRAEICRTAAKARWAKRRKQDGDDDRGSSVSERALVTWHGPAPEGVPSDCLVAIQSTAKLEVPTRDATTKQLFDMLAHSSSHVAMASRAKVSAPTVKLRLRQLASIILFSSRVRMWSAIQRVHDLLSSRYDDYLPLLHVVKQRYDEFSLKLKVSNCVDDADGDGDADDEISAWRRDDDVIVAKLMQTRVDHAFLFRADNQLITLESSLPSILKPVESTHAKNIKEACRQCAGDCKWADETFNDALRISLHDAHPSNALADCSIFADNPKRCLLMWLCMIHHGHKTCEYQWQVFPAELKGVLASVLATHGPFSFRNWKRAIKMWLRLRGQWTAFETGTPSPDSQNYNDKVFYTWCNGHDLRLDGMKARERQKINVAKRVAFSGILDDPLAISHVCKHRFCCTCKADAIKKMCSAVEGEIMPKCWALNRWLGSEDGLDFCGFWLACGGLFIVGVLVGWLKMKVSDVEGVVVEYMRGAVPVQVAEEVGFDECTKEMSDFERQTTYRRNVQLWLKTVPLPRMWVLKSLVNTQQTHQKELLKTSGLPFEREQLRREAEGMPRKLKPLIALQMEITGPTLKKYGKLMVDAGQWNHLPAECKIQSFAMSGFRCAAKSAATLYTEPRR